MGLSVVTKDVVIFKWLVSGRIAVSSSVGATPISLLCQLLPDDNGTSERGTAPDPIRPDDNFLSWPVADFQ